MRCHALLLCGFLLASCASARAQGYAPDVAPSKMTVADGFAVDLVAAEPHVRQPVCIEFDDSGRLWVVQYLQYPNPAGLKRVKVDRYSRTVYDRVPEPPPRGPKGADRITILEDTNGDGRVDRAKDFVSGLNLATGIAFGYGGVFVLNVPYLLFYPDRNHDDVPDADPEVLLSGFGMEDTSSLANSLTWGPDGWLYGTQGTNITAHIRGIDFEQGVWRYHPLTREFELFCEGGGNSWGLDFDEAGTLYFSTNYGGYVMLHGLQGAYYAKQFQKHGELHNRFAFGYFDHVPHQGFQGGHVTTGGIVYQESLFPARFRGAYIAADLLGHRVNWHTISRDGSTVRTAHGGSFLAANDTWFAPSDVTVGPDGAVYVADWHDKRTAHPDPDADWDKSNGRVYRIRPAGTGIASLTAAGRAPARAASTGELVEQLFLPAGWHSRRALRALAERRDAQAVAPLRERLRASKAPKTALKALWGIYASGGFDESLALELLRHPAEAVRAWTVRYLGDQHNVRPAVEMELLRVASSEKSPVVLAQLACSAKRWPAACGLRVAGRVAGNSAAANDRYIPLLVWWAVERHATADRDLAIRTFASDGAWRLPLVRAAILGRLIKRYAAEGTKESFAAAARIFATAPSAAEERRLLAELDEGLKMIGVKPARELPLGSSYTRFAVASTAAHSSAHRFAAPPAELLPMLDRMDCDRTSDPVVLSAAYRLGRPQAGRRIIEVIADDHTPAPTCVALLRILDELGDAACIPAVLGRFRHSTDEDVRGAALATLGRFDEPQIANAVLDEYPRLDRRLRAAARGVLLVRRDWARRLLARIDQGKIDAADVEPGELRQIALLNDRELDAAVRHRWGTIRAGTPEEKLADIRRLSNDLRAAAGRPAAGHELFKKHCATCHTLFGEGTKIGPDLTTANRKDRDFLLVSVVDPNVQIRKEFLSYAVRTQDGRVHIGLIAEQDASSVTVVGAKNERTRIPRADIEEVTEQSVSLMPEKLLDPLKPQEVRDLFSYLEK